MEKSELSNSNNKKTHTFQHKNKTWTQNCNYKRNKQLGQNNSKHKMHNYQLPVWQEPLQAKKGLVAQRVQYVQTETDPI